MDVLSTAWAVTRRVFGVVWNLFAWSWAVRRTLAVCVVLGNLLLLGGVDRAAGYALIWCVPAFQLLRALWLAIHPLTYEAVLGGPLRRRSWRRYVRKRWLQLADRCGLATTPRGEEARIVPRLRKARTAGNTLTLTVQARVGQTVDDLTSAAEAIATALRAEAVETRRVAPGVVEMALTMCELLHVPTLPTTPHEVDTSGVTLGRVSDGNPWRLDLAGRHTLVVGCTGAGKGSLFWGIAGNLAPAANAGLVNLWGVDLKGGVEVAVGKEMFSHVAMDEDAAVRLLRALNRLIVTRQAAMRGLTRSFAPTPGDPVHVLMIDELAVLTAYASKDVVNEAANLLKLILTQGRAFGVMVVAFVQDPRKETVGMRDLFTQIIALRLRSSSETRMVLGDGLARLAPAHGIDPAMPGTGYVVGDDGFVQRVRADYWADDFIRMVAGTYPAPPTAPLPEERATVATPVEATDSDSPGAATVPAPTLVDATPPRQRAPRKPRAPRVVRTSSTEDIEAA